MLYNTRHYDTKMASRPEAYTHRYLGMYVGKVEGISDTP